MADLTYCSFNEFGEGAFCIHDYRDIGGDEQADGKILGLILYPNDEIVTINAFARLAAELNPEIVMVEFYYLQEDASAEARALEAHAKVQLSLLVDKYDYFNMDSYEHRIALGKFTINQIADYFTMMDKLRAKRRSV